MAIQIQCSSCRAVYPVFEPAIGRRIRCPRCNELITATPYQPPAGEQPAADTQQQEEEIVELLPVEAAPAVAFAEPAALPPRLPPPVLLAAPDTGGSGGAVREEGPQRPRPVIFRGDRERPEAVMDMTPMVDVTFLLLIFFMVTASYVMQKSLQVPKPEASEPSAQPRSIQEFQESPDYIVVRVDSYNTFHISAAAFADEIEAPNEQQLLVKLRQARQGDAHGRVPTKMLVVASGEARHERVVTAIDAGNELGLQEVQLVTVEEE